MKTGYPRAMLFDMDDTILAYTAALTDAWRMTCQHFAPRLPGLEVEALTQAIHDKAEWYWNDQERHRRGRLDLLMARREIVLAVFADSGIDDPALAHEMSVLRNQLHEDALAPFPGAIETLHQLRASGVRMGMLTNGAEAIQTRKIDRFGLRPLFDCILIEGAFGVGKPDARMYHHALADLDVEAADAWMVGDNLTWDIDGAQRVGIHAIWNDFRGTGLPPGATVQPDRIVQSITELLEPVSSPSVT